MEKEKVRKTEPGEKSAGKFIWKRMIFPALILCLTAVLILQIQTHQKLNWYYEQGLPFYSYAYSGINMLGGAWKENADGTWEVDVCQLYAGLYQLRISLQEIDSYCAAGLWERYQARGMETVTFQGEETALEDGKAGSRQLISRLELLQEEADRWLNAEVQTENTEYVQTLAEQAAALLTEIDPAFVRYEPPYPITPEGMMAWYTTVMAAY